MTPPFPILKDTSLEDGWPESVASLPPEGPSFLFAHDIRDAAGWTELEPGAIDDCLEAAERIHADENLRTLAWHAHRRFVLDHLTPARPGDWPDTLPDLDDLTGVFYLLLALSGIEPMRAIHAQHDIPDDVTRLNCRDIHIWAREFKTLGIPGDHGFAHPFDPPRWGLHTRGLGWIAGSLRGRILRIGRLQFIHDVYEYPNRAYRNTETRAVQVVAEDGLAFTDDGWRAKDDDPSAWRSALTESPHEVRAHPVTPNGRAHREPLTLSLDTWTPALVPGDSILEVHIPEDGPMGFDDCGASIVEVIRDYPRYYPDRPFRAIVCGSWLLDPQFQDGMPASSNICRFQRECYLFPIGPGGGRSGFFRLFTHDDIATLPRDTVMRRTYLDLLESGGLWRGGGMLLFPEDLDWGNQVYLSQHCAEGGATS